MTQFREVATGLEFPEGPVWMPDGSVILVEIKRQTLTRVLPNGEKEIIANLGGGPNGAALGPDGAIYVCNNGGSLCTEIGPFTVPGDQHGDYTGGSIQRVDLETGEFTTLYSECGGIPLRGPNDLVFDRTGGIWFTDTGKTRARERDRTGVFYARSDGSEGYEVIFPLEAPNGIGLSPDGDRLYVSETQTGRVYYWELEEPGKIHPHPSPNQGHLLVGLPGLQMLDSLAIDSSGRVCVATIVNGGISILSPDGQDVQHIPLPDPCVTNIAFGGEDLHTAYITLGSTGRLVAIDWDVPGLGLAF